jgi:hypothetical protein
MMALTEGVTYYGSAFDRMVSYTVLRYIDKPDHNGAAALIEAPDGKRFYLSAVNYTLADIGVDTPDAALHGTHETIVMDVNNDKPDWGQPLLQLTGIADLHTVAIMFLAHRDAVADRDRAVIDYLQTVANEDPDKTVSDLLHELDMEAANA